MRSSTTSSYKAAMTSTEAAARLCLTRKGAHALSELCRKGCDPGSLCALVIRLTAPPVTIQPRPRPGPGKLRRTTASGLQITGGFAAIPEEGRELLARQSSDPSPVPEPSPDSHQAKEVEAWERPFKSRELKALRQQMTKAAADVRQVLTGVLARPRWQVYRSEPAGMRQPGIHS